MKLDDILQAEIWIELYMFHEGSYYEKADLWYIETMWHDNKKPKYFISKEAVNAYKDLVVKRLKSEGYAETTDEGTFYNKRSDNNMYYVSITDCKVKKENIVAIRDALFVLNIKNDTMYRLYDTSELSNVIED
ncbi:MAG: hypothetical protein ACP5OA_05450 [Candidatus Woesearchaeota archaeon]